MKQLRNADFEMRNKKMNVNKDNLKERTKRFALHIIKLVESLPRDRIADVIGRQLLRAGISVGDNYRAACRAISRADFIAKMGIVEEEVDETIYWLELFVEGGILKLAEVELLMKEGTEILAIAVSSIRTAKKNKR